MKKIVILAAACTLLAGAAQAQQAASPSPLYGELGYTHLDFKDSGTDAHPGMLRGIVGYDLHPHVAVEGMLAFGVRKGNVSGSVAGIPFSGELKVRHSFGLFVKPKADLGDFELFARLGWAQTKVRTSVTVLGATFSDTASDSDFAYGAGLNWKFSQNAYVGFDLMRYYDKDGARVNGTALSIGTRW